MTTAPPTALEKRVVTLLVAAQFMNILDFVMVMPLGPALAGGLGIPTARIGLIAGSYTAAAAVSGFLGALFLDRFDRRQALAVCLWGLSLGTLAAGLATGQNSLMAARVLAGIFGGPATTLCFSIISDVVPAPRRGRAVGEIVAAFSMASIVGVPIGLKLANMPALGGWRAPFLLVGLLTIPVALGAWRLMPPLRGHMEGLVRGSPAQELYATVALLGQPLVRQSLAMSTTAMIGAFMVIPNLATHMQRNLGYPPDAMDRPYLAGGIASWLVSRFLAGRLVDRYGSLRGMIVGVCVLVPLVLAMLLPAHTVLPVVAFYALFMTGMGFRNVSFNTIATKVARPSERARFQSLQSAVNHCGTSLGAFLSTALLTDLPDGHVAGMARVAIIFVAMHLMLPLLVRRLERGLLRQGLLAS